MVWGGNVLGMMSWEPGGVLTGTHPSLTLSLFCPCVAERALGPCHFYSTHPIWWVHHPGWCLSLNISLTLPGNLAGNEWHRGEGCNPDIQHNYRLSGPNTSFDMWQDLLCPCPWRLAAWPSYGLQTPCGAIGHGMNAWNLQIYQTMMTLMRKLMLYFSHFWIHDLVRGGAPHNSHCPQPSSHPHCDTQSHWWCTVLAPSLGTSHHSAAVGKLA